MPFSKTSFRTFFLAAWGAVVLILQIPLTKMILDDPQTLSLGAWDNSSLVLFCGITFLLIPAAVGVVIAGLSRISTRWVILGLALATGFCLLMQANFYYLQIYFMAAPWRKFALCALLLLWIAVFWRFRRLFLETFQVCAILSIGILLVFVVQTAPTRQSTLYYPPADVSSQREKMGPIFILTFEKIASAYVADEDGRILTERLPNLARFVSEADYYPNTYSNSTATVYGLKTIYSGRVTTTDRNWTRFPNIRDLVGGKRVYMVLDLLTSYSDPGRHYLIRTIGQKNRNGKDIVRGWYKTYLTTILPDFLERPLVLAGWHFNPWFDLWAGEAGELQPGENIYHKVGTKQFQNLKEIVQKEGATPNLYIMHNFISDGCGVNRVGAKDPSGEVYRKELETARQNLAAFDRELGSFIGFLKEKGLYDRSLILVTTDTGADCGVNSVKGEPEFPAFSETARIFLALKRPDQRSGRVFRSVFRHVDIFPTILSDLGMDPSPFHFEGVPVTDPDQTATLEQRPLHFLVTPQTEGIMHYRLENPNGPFRKIR